MVKEACLEVSLGVAPIGYFDGIKSVMHNGFEIGNNWGIKKGKRGHASSSSYSSSSGLCLIPPLYLPYSCLLGVSSTSE